MGIRYKTGTTGQTWQAQIWTSATTVRGIALPESPAGSGVYQCTNAEIVLGGGPSTDDDYDYDIHSGAVSHTPVLATPAAQGRLGWTGSSERPLKASPSTAMAATLAVISAALSTLVKQTNALKELVFRIGSN